MKKIALLIPFQKEPKPILPIINDAIQKLREEDIAVQFFDPQTASPSVKKTEWVAVYDRYPSILRERSYSLWRKQYPKVVHGNTLPFIQFCENKKLSQQCLENKEIVMPALLSTNRSTYFKDVFEKPIFGSAGKGILFHRKNTPLPPINPQTTIFQEAVPPPKGWAGWCVRQLAQKNINEKWLLRTPILRRSTTDPVVNATRGAVVDCAADVLSSDTYRKIQDLSLKIVAVFDSMFPNQLIFEVGLDFVVDKNFSPWFLEANARPRGKLRYLYESEPLRFREEYQAAWMLPFRYLAKKCSQEA
ncbi:MAG: YheC/YheD family protein [Myxococcota bacterium]|nr:YheC/YheD family protein [Myxococcota bacterium]